jgi:hypothetical protein
VTETAGAPPHHYVSTACQHEKCGSCRNTCKFCGAPCLCTCHPEGALLPASPVDQARGIARELYEALTGYGITGLLERVQNDPDLFWLLVALTGDDDERLSEDDHEQDDTQAGS